MNILVVLGVMFSAIALGLPSAYALALAALAGALWIGIPVEAVMLQISSGVSKFAMLTIPFFVLAGAIMAEGGIARRLVALAHVLYERDFRLVGRGRFGDRLGDDPANGALGLSAGLRHQCDDLGLGAGSP